MDSCLLTPLRTIESSTKSIASVLVVILHASHDIITAFDTTKEGSHYRSQLISTVLPLLGSSGSQIRILSQIIMHRLHPEGYENSHNSNGSKDGSSDSVPSSSSSLRDVIVPILKFLREQKDMIRMRNKQEKLFIDAHLNIKCSMKGLLSTTMNSFGEFYEPPLIDKVKKACIEFQRETELLYPERFYYRSHKNGKMSKTKLSTTSNKISSIRNSTKKGSTNAILEENAVTGLVSSAVSVEDSGDISFNFQQKIQPWSSLAALQDDASSNVRSGIQSKDKKSRQSLVVVASLLDKIPNLGGLARTSEIFGASKLVIGKTCLLLLVVCFCCQVDLTGFLSSCLYHQEIKR